MNIDALLQRIGYQGERHASLSSLTALKESFLLSVPFENLDIHGGPGISLDPATIEDKIVARRRGGLCYENNSLFARLLTAMGFEVRLCSAQMGREDHLSPPYEHLALLVTLDGASFLTDVGNGESARVPMAVGSAAINQTPEGKAYRLTGSSDRIVLECQETPDTDWKIRFVLDPKARALEEFADRCHFHQTSPESVFTSAPLATLARPNGRVTLRDRILTTTSDGKVETREIPEESRDTLLRTHFGIER